jgi:hypothetical protein
MPRSSQTVLSKRQLNRALLARQMLLKREKISAVAAVERLVGMQAQVPRPPFMGLWTRLEKFEAEALHKPLRERKVVRATAMRGTIHLMSTTDFLAFRPVLAEMLVKGATTIVGKQMANVDLERVYRTGREFFGTQSATFDDFRKHLEEVHPDWDVRGMAYTVRMGIPLVMVPADVNWGFPGNAGFMLAEKWLGQKIPTEATALEEMVLRYLAAFGPATPADFQTWSAIRGARPVFETLRPKLLTFGDERKRELFDLPKAPRPDADTPAPVRFLPEYDNALLAHDDRTRIVADEHRAGVFLKNLQVVGTFLVDGFVAGTWKVERKKKDAALALSPFGPIPKRAVAELENQGESLLAFLEDDSANRSVRVGKP